MANYAYKKIKIRHVNTGKMLNVYFTGSVVDGTNVTLYTDDGSLEQQWYFDGAKLQTMRDRSKVLDRHRGTNNADVWTDEAAEDVAQKITIISSAGGYKIKLLASTHYLTNDGSNVIWSTSGSSTNSLWIIEEADTSTPATHNGITSGYYNIINRNSGKYLNVTYGTDANGTTVIVYDSDGSVEQNFRVRNTSTYAEIFAMCSSDGYGRVLDAYRSASAVTNGAKAQIWDNNDPTSQQMVLTAVGNYFKICLKSNTDLALTAGASSCTFSSYTGSNNQLWSFKAFDINSGSGDLHTPPKAAVYNIISCDSSGKARNLNVTAGKDANGTSVVMYEDDGTVDQQFKLQANIGYARLVAMCSASGRVLDAYRPSGSVQSGTKAQIWTPDDDISQQLIITHKGNNRYKIALKSNKNLALTAANTTNNLAQVTYSTYSENNLKQLWTFEEVASSTDEHTPPKSATYNIISADKSGGATYLNVTSGRDSNGTPVIMYEPDGTLDQQFKLLAGNGFSKLEVACSTNGRVLDAYRPSGAVENGTKAQIWTPDDDIAQQLLITNKGNDLYKIALKSNPNLALTASGINNLSGVMFSSFGAGNLRQLWQFKEVDETDIGEHNPPIATTYNLYCANGYLNVTNGLDWDGTSILTYTSDGTADQVFRLENLSNGSRLRAQCSSNGNDRVLDAYRVPSQAVLNEAKVQLWKPNDETAQILRIVPSEVSGKYIISLASNPNLVLTSQGAGKGCIFKTFTNDSVNQLWSFKVVTSWNDSSSSGSGDFGSSVGNQRVSWRPSPKFYENRNGYPKIEAWVCHICEGYYEGSIAHLQNPSVEASAHFVIGKEGQIAQLVDIKNGAWCNGSTPTDPSSNVYNGKSRIQWIRENNFNANLFTISIEFEGFHHEKQGAINAKQMDSAVWLIDYVNKKYMLTIPLDREHIIGHSDVTPISKPLCPGDAFQFDELIRKLKDKAGATEPNPDPPAPPSGSLGSKGINPPPSIENVDIMARYNAPLPFTGTPIQINNVPNFASIDKPTMHRGSGFKPLQAGTDFYEKCRGTEIQAAISNFISKVFGSSYASISPGNYLYYLFGEHDDTFNYHLGIDMTIGEGSPIYPLFPGHIVAVKTHIVYIYVPDLEITTVYMHMKDLQVTAADADEEKLIGTDKPIGYQSSVGAGSSSHLHFEIKPGKATGTEVNHASQDDAITSIIPYGYMK